jgi:tetratricopeptide (TPR) repeat protein
VPLSTIAFGLFMTQAHTAADLERAREAATEAAGHDLNDREVAYLEALRRWIDGNTNATLDALGRLLDLWPTDLFALRLELFALFGQCRYDDMIDSTRRAIDAWDDRPFRSHLDGMVAFALEELGDYAEAERLGRAASEADPSDLWSIHSVAHVLEMQARTDDGLAWFDGRADELARHGSFARHLWWHHAIIHLRTGDHARLLELYDTQIQPGDATDTLSMTNAIDALARLEFAGVDVGDRWAPLVAPASFRIGHHDHPFSDCHASFALARAGATDALETLLASMADWQDNGTSAGEVIAEVGLATARGMAELGAGNSERAAQFLVPTGDLRWRLGGSHAQRRVFDLAQARALSPPAR